MIAPVNLSEPADVDSERERTETGAVKCPSFSFRVEEAQFNVHCQHDSCQLAKFSGLQKYWQFITTSGWLFDTVVLYCLSQNAKRVVV